VRPVTHGRARRPAIRVDGRKSTHLR
jgi:hypothetical protein